MSFFHKNTNSHFSGVDRFIQRGPFLLDLQTNRVQVGKEDISLPPCTFQYMVTLVKHAPHPVTYKQLVADSQGYHLPEVEAQDLARMRVFMLRKAIERNIQKPRYILSVPGTGYRLSV